jgi:endonuclease YncB( thermonuclease family)
VLQYLWFLSEDRHQILFRSCITIPLRNVIWACVCLFSANSSQAQTVQDGDSIIRSDGVRVRLYGIDAPEKDQPYGKEARKILKQYMPLVAKMKEYDEDRYGRLIVELFTEDNKSINAAMICSGAAWWYEYYAPDRPQFKQCQEDAQKNKRGLWAEEDPLAPWDWRRR